MMKGRTVDQMLNHKLLRDMLAKTMHEIWVETTTILAQEGLTPERLARWSKYWQPYIQLAEDVKEQDRLLADRIIKTLNEYIDIIGTKKVFLR